jgi:hypothetical protein
MDASNQKTDTQFVHKDIPLPITHVKYSKEENRTMSIIALYTFAWVLGLTLIAAYADFQDPSTSSIPTYLILLGCAGGIGGSLNSILGFTTHYKNGDFDPNYKWWYYFRPIIGIILGVFVFYFIVGGLMVISTTDQNPDYYMNIFSFKSIMFYSALSFLVGYSSTNFLRKLEDLSNALFSEVKSNGDGEDKDKIPKPVGKPADIENKPS